MHASVVTWADDSRCRAEPARRARARCRSRDVRSLRPPGSDATSDPSGGVRAACNMVAVHRSMKPASAKHRILRRAPCTSAKRVRSIESPPRPCCYRSAVVWDVVGALEEPEKERRLGNRRAWSDLRSQRRTSGDRDQCAAVTSGLNAVLLRRVADGQRPAAAEAGRDTRARGSRTRTRYALVEAGRNTVPCQELPTFPNGTHPRTVPEMSRHDVPEPGSGLRRRAMRRGVEVPGCLSGWSCCARYDVDDRAAAPNEGLTISETTRASVPPLSDGLRRRRFSERDGGAARAVAASGACPPTRRGGTVNWSEVVLSHWVRAGWSTRRPSQWNRRDSGSVVLCPRERRQDGRRIRTAVK